MKPLNPSEPIHITRQNLPHWRQDGTTYFVTSRLADSLPKHVIEPWQAKRSAWLREHQATSLDDLALEWHLDYHRLFTDAFHQLLDSGHGSCFLAQNDCAAILTGKMTEGHGTCFDLGAWCIMPNHFHAILTPNRGSVLGDIIQHWKGGSAFAINRLIGRRGTLWQSEPYDHIVRSESQLQRLNAYVADNPMKAGLQEGFVLGCGAEAGLTREQLRQRCSLGL